MTGQSANRQRNRIAEMLHAPSYLLWLIHNRWLLHVRMFLCE